MLGTLVGAEGSMLICNTVTGQRKFPTAEGRSKLETTYTDPMDGIKKKAHLPLCKVYTPDGVNFAPNGIDALQVGDELEIEGRPAVKVKVLKRVPKVRRY